MDPKPSVCAFYVIGSQSLEFRGPREGIHYRGLGILGISVLSGPCMAGMLVFGVM